MAEGPSGDRGGRRGDIRGAGRSGAGGRGHRRSRRAPRRVPHLPRDRGGAASERRPPAPVPGRDVSARIGRPGGGGAGRLRRTQRADGSRRRLRAGGHACAGHWGRPQAGRHPGRRIERDALLRAGDGAVGRPRRHHRPARGCAARRALHRLPRPERSGLRHRHHPQPPRRARRARGGAGSGGAGAGHAKARARRAGDGDVRQPHRRHAA